MDLQQLMESAGSDITEGQARAMFLGAMTGEKPLTVERASEELLGEDTERSAELDRALKALWDKLKKDLPKSLLALLEDKKDPHDYFSEAMTRLDYFLTGFSLAGNTKNEELAEVAEELEDLVLDLEEHLEAKPDQGKDEEMKDQIQGAWEEFVSQWSGDEV